MAAVLPIKNVKPRPVVPGGIYRLDYIQHNSFKFQLVRFDKEDLDIGELVKLAKRYCVVNNFRFVFIGPAIITVDIESLENVVE